MERGSGDDSLAPHRGRVSNFGGLPAARDQSGFPADAGTCGLLTRCQPTNSAPKRNTKENGGIRRAGETGKSLSIQQLPVKLNLRLLSNSQSRTRTGSELHALQATTDPSGLEPVAV